MIYNREIPTKMFFLEYHHFRNPPCYYPFCLLHHLGNLLGICFNMCHSKWHP
jgi:hypothetical protein